MTYSADVSSPPSSVRRAAPGRRIPVTTVRYDGIHHDFMMLNPLSETQATRAAVAQAASVLRDALWRIRP
jgi:acetyl esterase/lipase